MSYFDFEEFGDFYILILGYLECYEMLSTIAVSLRKKEEEKDRNPNFLKLQDPANRDGTWEVTFFNLQSESLAFKTIGLILK